MKDEEQLGRKLYSRPRSMSYKSIERTRIHLTSSFQPLLRLVLSLGGNQGYLVRKSSSTRSPSVCHHHSRLVRFSSNLCYWRFLVVSAHRASSRV